MQPIRSTSDSATLSRSADFSSQASFRESWTSALIAPSGFFNSCESCAESCSSSRARAIAS